MENATPQTVLPSQRPVKPRLYTDHIPGDKAVLCMDCREVWDIRFEACPVCSSKACLHILRTLDGRRAA